MAKFICSNCHEEQDSNNRLKDGIQHYCGAAECQRARKAAWQREQIHNNANYRAKQIACLKQWRKRRPLDQYQKQYRQRHPDYVEQNRQQQRRRNNQRQRTADWSAEAQIVKMNALPIPLIQSGTYQLTPLAKDGSTKIVKMDALIVQLNILHQANPPMALRL
jgi:hypothetical protein